MAHIGSGLGRAQLFVRSVDEAVDIIAPLGYDGIEFEQRGRDVIATSHNAKGQRAQAMGHNRVVAAQTLVKVITR